MTTIIFTFFISFLASLLLCPLVIRIARRLNIVDMPSDRKVHKQPVPRIGGVVLFLSFFLPLVLLYYNKYMFRELIAADDRLIAFVAGALIVFGLGLWDDVKPLPAWVKFIGQVLAALVAYYGGMGIHIVSVPFVQSVHLGIFSLPASVFWFVLVINAINLIDGLDGLAAGISLFVSITMMVICLTNHKLLEAVAFAALGGALIGFLRYNFNPATIFMGDSGSYFLGYTLAALSVMGSIKGQVATAMLIPIIALGIPLVDTLWAPIRRFALGKKMFQPDTDHLHHRLVELGYTHRRAVLIIYGLTIILGIVSITLVHANNETAALVLVVVGTGVIFLGRYVGIKDFISSRQISYWFHDVSDATGIARERRSFYNHQLAMAEAEDMDQLWEEACRAMEDLELDEAELVLYNPDSQQVSEQQGIEGIKTEPIARYTWHRQDVSPVSPKPHSGLLRIEQPLLPKNPDKTHYSGKLVIIKDIHGQKSGQYTLKRIEDMRRTINETLDKVMS